MFEESYENTNFIFDEDCNQSLNFCDDNQFSFSFNEKNHLSEKDLSTEPTMKKDIIISLTNENKNSVIRVRKRNNIKNKKFMGRKRTSDKDLKNSEHTKYSKDNASYHIKVIFQNFIYEFIEYYSKKYSNGMKLKKISGKILKQGNKNFNMDLFNQTIEQILKSNISPKFTYNKDNTNIQLIDDLKSKCDIIKTFCSKTYRECFNEYYLMKSEKFEKEYYKNSKHLFANINFKTENDEKFYKQFILEFFKYFEKKIPRITINSE